MFAVTNSKSNQAPARKEVTACFVEGDDAQSNEATERETRRAQANWVSLGNGGFFTRPAVLSDYA